MINKEVRANIISAVDDLKQELIKLTSDIVSIPSITPTYPGERYGDIVGGETKVNEYLKPLLEDVGLKTDMWAVEKERANLVGVYKGTGGGKSLIFNGHVDVVPPGAEEEWTEASPWSGMVSDGKIWGRGASDMKGGNAAALISLKALLKAGYKPKGDVILEYVVGEEMMNTPAGTGAVIKRGYRADGAIVVEPTSHPYRMSLVPVSLGVFYMAVNIKGRAVHACMRGELVRDGGGGSKVGVSSIDKAMVIYNGLKL